MNSFELYNDYFQKSKTQPLKPEQKSVLINDVVKTVFAELNAPPFELGNSPFLVNIGQIIEIITASANKFFPTPWKGKSIIIFDAFAVIHGVKQSFLNKNYSLPSDENISCYSEYFFKDLNAGNEDKEFIAAITRNLKDVQKILRELQAQYQTTKIAVEQKITFQADVQPQPDDEMQILGRSNATSQPAQTILRQPQSATQPVQIPAKSAEKNAITPALAEKTAMQEFTEKTNAQIEWQKHIAEIEEKQAEESKNRRENNRQKISVWHIKQAELIQSVKALQMPAQALLEDFRYFSKKLTENYIIQFANSQIELFNSIADSFDWHESRAKESQNQDYHDAVANYKSYLEMIVDALADFGVEEISSDKGTPFDGKIHDVKNTRNFSPKFATVKKSLRAGFKYGDLILQKEEVEV